MKPVAILASGMVSAVGLNAPASCAAIRCAIDNFTETRFMDKGGEWIIGAQVPLEQPWRGLPKLVHMVVPAINECREWLATVETNMPATDVPLLLCVAEKGRPGRLEGLDDELFEEIQRHMKIRFHPRSAVIAQGRVAGAVAMEHARRLIYEEKVPYCIIAGTDTLLVAQTLAAYEEKNRLLTSQNSNGFIPGEAGAAILVSKPRNNGQPELLCLGIGHGTEKAGIDTEEPLRGDGLVQAFKSAFADAGCIINDLDFRITDSNGEQYWFKEATLALDRILRKRHELFEIWHPVDCLGEIGASIAPCAMAIALRSMQREYAFGRGPLCHFGTDGSERMALVLTQTPGGRN
jgi:3-oxoacyl-[acyl-carrier-protein] synthase-1